MFRCAFPGSWNKKKWVLETDRASRAQGGGAGIVLRTPHELAIVQVNKFDFAFSNNEAEYEVVILGLRVAKSLSLAAIEHRCHSRLVAS